jgi:glycine cleavage system H protein
MSWNIKAGLKYTKKHEWVQWEEGAETVTVGLSDYAQDKLGSIVFVEFPDPGTEVKPGESVAVVESVKAVADTYSPVEGTIVEVNEALLDQPELLNEDPYGDGWMVKIQLAPGADPAGLMDEEEYEAHLRREEEE